MMLFYTTEFIFIFLPITLAGFWLTSRYGGQHGALAWLAGASIAFYGLWDPGMLLLLLASVVINFFIGRCIGAARHAKHGRLASWILGLGIVCNLAILGSFKYANFFIYNLNVLAGSEFSFIDLLFPIGISFYTFIQIGYLIDVKNGQAGQPPFAKYLLFATFFPYVTAGPIVLQHEIFSQLEKEPPRFNIDRIVIGLVFFSIGLFKKLVLADGVAVYASAAFRVAAQGDAAISALDAWLGAFAYTLRLYFDFSGYSDMALALGFMFGIRLPFNFNSPLKATSIIEFWRRWHMTMTRFFTNYIYTPVAMSMTRRSLGAGDGAWKRFAVATAYPMILTFTIAGLWHEAGWMFVVFGAIHGVALTINHAWRQAGAPALPAPVCWALTLLVFVVSLVFFRSPSMESAWVMLKAMFGFGNGTTFDIVPISALPKLALLLLISLLAPNSQELMRRVDLSCDAVPESGRRWPDWLAWRPTPIWTAAGALLLAGAISLGAAGSPFIYYQY